MLPGSELTDARSSHSSVITGWKQTSNPKTREWIPQRPAPYASSQDSAVLWAALGGHGTPRAACRPSSLIFPARPHGLQGCHGLRFSLCFLNEQTPEHIQPSCAHTSRCPARGVPFAPGFSDDAVENTNGFVGIRASPSSIPLCFLCAGSTLRPMSLSLYHSYSASLSYTFKNTELTASNLGLHESAASSRRVCVHVCACCPPPSSLPLPPNMPASLRWNRVEDRKKGVTESCHPKLSSHSLRWAGV